MEDYSYYIYALAIIIIGLIILKKVAGCIVRIVITLAILAILAAIYYIGFYQG